MNIYQKLLEVRKAVPFLKKDNAGYQFKYVSSSQTLGALREAMDANGLVLIPKVTGERVLDHTTKKGDHNYFTILNMEFTWVNIEDPKEMVVCPWVGQGLDDGEKGVGKALTYAEKFFLLKFFNIPTDKDDPDANQKKPENDKAPNSQPEILKDKPKAKPGEQVVSVMIKNVESKAGEKNGKAYTIFTIFDTQDTKYGTFSDTFADLARSAKETGAMVNISYTEGQYGNKISDLTIVEM
jgi:hypothetical protein